MRPQFGVTGKFGRGRNLGQRLELRRRRRHALGEHGTGDREERDGESVMQR
jgi:hypothetical protein